MRPPLYSEEKLAAAKKYILDYEEYKDAMPGTAGLARALSVARSTLYEWAGHYEEFKEVMETLQSEQERILLNKGLLGKFNPAITALALGKHGFHRKVDSSISGGDRPLETKHTIEIIDGASSGS